MTLEQYTKAKPIADKIIDLQEEIKKINNILNTNFCVDIGSSIKRISIDSNDLAYDIAKSVIEKEVEILTCQISSLKEELSVI